jgi:hypothetical protein
MDDVLSVAAERFERRLTEEIGGLRIDMAKEFATLRVEMSSMRTDLPKWMFLFWVAQVGAVGGILAFLLRALGPK